MTAANANSAKVIQWQKDNPEKYKARMQAWRLENKYGITVEEYNAMLAGQGGVCTICSEPPTDKRKLAVDHCHRTSKVRALLCHVCNNLLGVFETRRTAFEAYLEKYGG